jgi:hypothetical protein
MAALIPVRVLLIAANSGLRRFEQAFRRSVCRRVRREPFGGEGSKAGGTRRLSVRLGTLGLRRCRIANPVSKAPLTRE